MLRTNQEKILNKFKSYVIQQARSRLTKGKHNVTRDLYNSLKGEVVDNKGKLSVTFEMDEYGMYMDKGVKGSNPSAVKDGKQKAPNSEFKFGNKKPPLKSILDWVKARGIRFRDKEGKFTRGNYKTIAFFLQRRIWAQGIKPTLFFTKPFNKAMQRLPEDFAKAYNMDLEIFLEKQFNE